MNHYSLIEAPHLSIETRAQIQLVQDLNQQLEGLKKRNSRLSNLDADFTKAPRLLDLS